MCQVIAKEDYSDLTTLIIIVFNYILFLVHRIHLEDQEDFPDLYYNE